MLKEVLEKMKQVNDLLPEGPRKEDTKIALAKAEKQLPLTDTYITDMLKHELCRAHYPPAKMTHDDKVWTCPECGNTKPKQPKTMILHKDGDTWCVTYDDFVNLQESLAVFLVAEESAMVDEWQHMLNIRHKD